MANELTIVLEELSLQARKDVISPEDADDYCHRPEALESYANDAHPG